MERESPGADGFRAGLMVVRDWGGGRLQCSGGQDFDPQYLLEVAAIVRVDTTDAVSEHRGRDLKIKDIWTGHRRRPYERHPSVDDVGWYGQERQSWQREKIRDFLQRFLRGVGRRHLAWIRDHREELGNNRRRHAELFASILGAFDKRSRCRVTGVRREEAVHEDVRVD